MKRSARRRKSKVLCGKMESQTGGRAKAAKGAKELNRRFPFASFATFARH
jgi:hypothetical protein